VTGHLDVIATMDALFERVAGDPAYCGDELLSAWLGDTLASLEPPVDKALAREVRRRWRQVHFAPWLEDVTYQEWLSAR